MCALCAGDRTAGRLVLVALTSIAIAGCSPGKFNTLGQPISHPPPAGGNPPLPPVGGGPPGDAWQTPEYKSAVGLARINAAAGYAARVPGKPGGEGIRVGVYDNGIDFNHPDLNAAKGGSENPSETMDHGTPVAGIVAARKNGLGMHGVAYKAALVDLSIKQVGQISPGKFQSDPTLLEAAAGLDPNRAWARSQVVNMSMSSTYKGYLAHMKLAAGEGLIMVISTGNDGRPQPDIPATFVTDQDIAGLGIAAGALDPNDRSLTPRAQFSNACGDAKNYCLFAPGVRVNSTSKGGGYQSFSGTSAAAPYVSGAIAVLLAAFPTRKPKEIVNRVLTTADDLGKRGIDEIYGHGALNLGAAMSPVGRVSMPIEVASYKDAPVVRLGSLRQGKAFRNLKTEKRLVDVLVYDEQRFPFLVDLTKGINSAFESNTIENFLARTGGERYRHVFGGELSGRDVEVAVGFAQSVSEGLGDGYDVASLFNAAETPIAISETAAPFQSIIKARSSAGMAVALSDTVKLSFSGASDQFRPASRAKWDPMTEFSETATHTKKTLGQLGLSYEGAMGGVMVQAGALVEKDGLLDSIGSNAMSIADGARSGFVQIGVRTPAFAGLSLLASYTHGWADVDDDADSIWSGFSNMRFNAFTVGGSYTGLFADGDRLTFTVGQPLRLASGSAKLRLPTGETDDGHVIMTEQRIDLVPRDRELLFQLGYQATVMDVAQLSVGSFLRLNPDHDANRDKDIGIGAKFNMPF